MTSSKPVSFDQGLPVYSGSKKIYPKRMSGRFRTIKWWSASLWLFYFFSPYLRWNGEQAILLNIPARQFRFFDLLIYPQDIWLLAFVLLFLAMLLVLLTAIAGRVFCGYFCFQTVWTDLFMWIEERIEGKPRERKKLELMPWRSRKLLLKSCKHALWLLVAAFTGVSFAAWFTDAYQLWSDYFILQADVSAWVVLGLFTTGTYLFAGFMREQVCFWLCPYARIQAVMYGGNTILPTYDYLRGEPRVRRGESLNSQKRGECVDCDLCVAVCPTGIDIRDGQQIGCITCGLCIDACDHVMEKISRPKGLIGYKSLNRLASVKEKALYLTPLVLTSTFVLIISLFIIGLGVRDISDFSLNVYHHRQPVYVKLSAGKIRNRYQIKIQNKSHKAGSYRLSLQGIAGVINPRDQIFKLAAGEAITRMVVLDAKRSSLLSEINPILFSLKDEMGALTNFETVFIGPAVSDRGKAG